MGGGLPLSPRGHYPRTHAVSLSPELSLGRAHILRTELVALKFRSAAAAATKSTLLTVSRKNVYEPVEYE